MIVPLTPLSFLRRAVKLFSGKTAVICGDARFTYAKFNERVQRLSHCLDGLGIGRDHVVAFLSRNCHRLLEAYYGVIQTGAILLPLNCRLAGDDFAFILNHSEARLLFLAPEFLPVITSIRQSLRPDLRCILLDKSPSHDWLDDHTYEEYLGESTSLPYHVQPFDENEASELFYTSGTTDRPKGVLLTHRNLYLHALNVIWALQISDRDVQLHTIPLFHANGWGATHTITAVGGTHVMIPHFYPRTVLQLIAKEKITAFNLIPTMGTMLLQAPAGIQEDFSSLRLIHLGGSSVPKEMVRQLKERFRCEVTCGYGLTESSPVMTVAHPKSHLDEEEDSFYDRSAMTGLELPGCEVRVVDENGADVCKNEKSIGEIILRSNTVMKGYWKQPEQTADAIRNGWLHTGDLATVNSENYLLIVDRKKDMIVRGGENIASIEIERVLYSHPAVLECAVIAVPDNRWGECPVAFVVLRLDHSCSSETLIQHCRTHLASFKVPDRIKLVESLPKGGTGKIQKRVLRETYWAGKDKQVS
jgi:fatty-acyl-CoA synthase